MPQVSAAMPHRTLVVVWLPSSAHVTCAAGRWPTHTAAVIRLLLQALDEQTLASTARSDSSIAGDAAARRWWDGGTDDAPGPADPV
jgi:hypothetical protein